MTERMRKALGAGVASGALMALVMVLVVAAPLAVVVAASAAVAAVGFASFYFLRPLVV